MGDWTQELGTLGDGVLNRLAEILDNPKCGWRQLAAAVTEQPKFRCSEKELLNCSLQVLSATGSPSRLLLSMLADRSCPLGFLLHCLRKIDHRSAVQYLIATVIRIIIQPQSQCEPDGCRLVLTCQAEGPKGMAYQWFKGKEEVPNGQNPDLVLCPFVASQQGHYICRVSHGENFVYSQWAKVQLASGDCPSSDARDGFLPSSTSSLRITQQPQPLSVCEGTPLRLECAAEGNPPPQYQWYHNNEPVAQATRPSLEISCATTSSRGQYSCKVFNLYHDIRSEEIHVEIGPGSFLCSSFDENDGGYNPPPARQHSRFYATDKVALLMGNMNYQHHRQLRAPMADVHQLCNLLRQLDFKVVSLLDLTLQEMHSAVTEFLLLLDRGVYGLLYFAGHGYENYGNSFMVPIDAPSSYTSEHCLWVQDVLRRMQGRQTGLNVFLLDMCRKRNLNDDVIPQPGPLKVTANIVFGYATCVDAEAYEVNKDGLSNGIFMSFLTRRLLEDEKVTVMLDKVAEDMGQCDITRGRQALELRSNLSERRALTDRVQSGDCPEIASVRNLQWAVANVLPDSLYLRFECGVTVQLGFAAEFSNIMIIYASVLEKPDAVVTCTAQLTDFSEDVGVELKLTNQESPMDAGSLLFTAETLAQPGFPSLYTRLSALQRLKYELSFSVCLHYQYASMDDEIQETRLVSVGKPLVSKLNLHQPRLPRSFSASSSCDLHCFSLPESSSFPDGLDGHLPASETSSIGSASTCWSFYQPGEFPDSPLPAKVNLPEETVSPEFLDPDLPRPLSADIRSLPLDNMERLSLHFRSKQNFSF
uniref:Mucosa-associated lymphoid tissue lymphoma translocation protein 1 homolog n=1 Tax=Paramormyrops kingsleyae TaxID=1676925 RepID=A0A3B3R135_9TELE|nr:mucosa-associated lymphoid tissue lymphoma translocation protein 1 homolog [Paramormyrops kingsleyae]XP_023674638.1 mucosa-associated lymphoid tissue lymphoma translocation protein 1 homolog [Paramormyrops kingsleyae]XP_023674639.1 mucosa-associated lymphoid tissue lymphoma translocation protein 1 homolog [Paramormyrops kingsleyae]